MSDKQMTISISKRPWYEWLLWAVWFVASLFVLQNAIASGQELEPRAAMLFWITFVILLLGGGIVYFIRRARLPK